MVDEQALNKFRRRDTMEVHIPIVPMVSSDSPNHSANTLPEIPIVTGVSFDTCARINAFTKYARVDIYIYMGDDVARLISIKPSGTDYVECIVEYKLDIMVVIVGAWIPFMMYLRRTK
jgi:hypothetical protein